MILKVENSKTRIIGASPDQIKILSKALRYPTEIARCQEMGIELPDSEDSTWDGWVRLLRIPEKSPPWFPTGLIHKVFEVAISSGIHVEIEDLREKPGWGFPELVKIPLRDYQRAAVEQALGWGRGVIDAVPRSGKTRILCEVHRTIALPTLWIAPTDRIVKQTHTVLEGFFGNNYATHLVGKANEEEASRAQVVVCTAATAVRLSSAFYKTRQCLIVDEHHHSASATVTKIFGKCDHIYYRYAATGTFFRSGEDEMAMHALLSKTLYKVTSEDLVAKGYLVPAKVLFVPVLAKRLMKMPSTQYNQGHGKYGISENVFRNQLISKCAISLHKAGKKTLILVGTKKQGNSIRKILSSFIPKSPDNTEFASVEFVSTDVPRAIQTRILESFEAGQEVKILIGTSLLGEGVDLPTTDALVYARGEKAEVTLVQSMYRVCTAVPGKDVAIVVDFADRHNRKLMEHSKERLAIYYKEPTFDVSVLDDPEKFEAMVESL